MNTVWTPHRHTKEVTKSCLLCAMIYDCFDSTHALLHYLFTCCSCSPRESRVIWLVHSFFLLFLLFQFLSFFGGGNWILKHHHYKMNNTNFMSGQISTFMICCNENGVNLRPNINENLKMIDWKEYFTWKIFVTR